MNFDPLPLLGNPHVQTILGTLLPGPAPPLRADVHHVTLADGDQLVLHETPPRDDQPRAPIVLLVHGLSGSAQSGYMNRMTHRLNELGWRAFRMDLRGAGAGLHLARRFYTAACSDDVDAALEQIIARYPEAVIAVVGFSLGGNIVLKLAGESPAGMRAVRAVAAIAPPIDLLRCSELMARQPFYDRWYVRKLIQQVVEHAQRFPDLPVTDFPRQTTLRQFDDLYTAPRWGYADALDYYRQASAVHKIGAIGVPTFILTARDDPFVAVEPFETLPTSKLIELHISPRGGHLGFLGRDRTGGIRWAETQVIDWLISVAASPLP